MGINLISQSVSFKREGKSRQLDMFDGGLFTAGNTWYRYGQYDDYPQKLIMLVAKSSTATACVNKRKDYIFSDGFSSQETANHTANLGNRETLNEISKTISHYQALFGGAFALQVIRHPFNITEVYLVGLENLRKTAHKTEYGEFVYSQKFNNKLRTNNLANNYEYYLPELDFNRSTLDLVALKNYQIEKYGQYYGEIYYYQPYKPGMGLYPQPDWTAGEYDVQSDISIQSLRLELLENGIMPSAFITATGAFSDMKKSTVDSEGNRILEDSPLEKLEKDLAQFGGGGNRGKAMVINSDETEGKISVTPFDLKPTIEGVEKMTNYVPTQVARAFNVPDILINGLRPGSLGNREELAISSTIFYKEMAQHRDSQIGILSKLYPELTFDFSQFNPYGL